MKTSSKPPTVRSPPPQETPLSPSRRSRAGSKSQSQSRITTDFPPLPPSTLLSHSGRSNLLPTSPRSRHRAPSISPSDSPSQAPLKAMRKALEEQARLEKIQSLASTSQVNDDAVASKRSPASLPGSPMSPSHHIRPFSPYRHAPTNEDLLHTAAAAALGMFLEERWTDCSYPQHGGRYQHCRVQRATWRCVRDAERAVGAVWI